MEYVQKHYLFLHAWKRGTCPGSHACRSCLLVVCCLAASAHNSLTWLRRLLPCRHTHAFVCCLGRHSSHLHYHLLLLWAALVEHLAVSHPSFLSNGTHVTPAIRLLITMLPSKGQVQPMTVFAFQPEGFVPAVMQSFAACPCNSAMVRYRSLCVKDVTDTGVGAADVMATVSPTTMGTQAL